MCRSWSSGVVLGLVVALSPHIEDQARAGDNSSQPGRNGQTSPGTYSLQVDPEDPYLRTGARYVLSLRGKQVWSGRRPYTLQDYTITDEGWVVGVAYSTPAQRPTGGGKRKLYLNVVILDPTGKEILNDVIERVPGPPVKIGVYQQVPLVTQILVDPENDRIIVRGRDDGTPGDARLDSWWTYRLSTGERLLRTRLMTGRSKVLDPIRKVFHTALVVGTPIVLVHWFIPSGGARFSLVTPEGKQLWAFDLDEDYADFDDAIKRDVHKYFAQHPGILETDQRGHFSIRSFSENQRITFAVTPAGEGEWGVKEIARVEYVEPPEAVVPGVLQDVGAFVE